MIKKRKYNMININKNIKNQKKKKIKKRNKSSNYLLNNKINKSN